MEFDETLFGYGKYVFDTFEFANGEVLRELMWNILFPALRNMMMKAIFQMPLFIVIVIVGPVIQLTTSIR